MTFEQPRGGGLQNFMWSSAVITILAGAILLSLLIAGQPAALLVPEGLPAVDLDGLARRGSVLALTGLGTLLAIRVGLANLGAEGQMVFGMLAALAARMFAPALPFPIAAVAAVLAAVISGALAMGLAAVLKSRFDANEALVTLLLNGVAAVALAIFLGVSPTDLAAVGMRTTLAVDPAMRGTPGADLTMIALGGAVVLTLLTAFVINATVPGFRIRAVGGNPQAANLAGIPVARVRLRVSLFSGACAGLAGGMLAAGLTGSAPSELTLGWGYQGLAAALFAAGSPLALLVWAPAIAALILFAEEAAKLAALPIAASDAVTALAILLALVVWRLAAVRPSAMPAALP